MNRLMIVVPCFNEQEVIATTCERLTGVIDDLCSKGKVDKASGILFVNDGSRDKTWELIKEFYENNPRVYGLNLSGNVGHQNALLAGLEAALSISDMTVSIDADLQDDISVIEEMVDKYISGSDVVYGVRNERKTDTFFKSFTAKSFYRLMNMLGTKTVYNHADFRLLSSRACAALMEYGERNVFLRGLVTRLGFNTDFVYYSRGERLAGESKYPFKKMLSFAWDGITSFSVKPINIVTGLGFFIILCSIAAFVYTLASYAVGRVIPGWSSLMISIWFLGGVQLFSIGLVGQYVGKTYIESKKRPRYHIESFLKKED